MPTMADITVKKADGTTDAVYTALNPSGGDGTWAMWRYNTGGSPVQAGKPTFQTMSKWNAARDVRRIQGKYLFPYWVTDTTTGITSVRKFCSYDFTAQIPQDVPLQDMLETPAQGGNLFVSALIKSIISTGYNAQ